ncbi:MAG: LCP family protein [Snowella sp.]|nr:LCP family protein [Snowella sp.]
MSVKNKPLKSTHKSSSRSSVRKKQYQSNTKNKNSWFAITLSLTAIALLSATAGALLAISLSSVPLKQAKLTPKQAAVFDNDKAISYKNLTFPQLSRPVNILVLGTKVLSSDIGAKSNAGYHTLVNSVSGLTDTMMLIRFDPEKQKLTVLSIPRDTQTEIKDHGVRKINEANALGGPSLAAETVSHLLGEVPIDRYLRVNVQAVEKLVDALGGVTVYVPKDMKYQDDSQHLYINLKEGEQHLDGNKTLQLLRFRKDSLGDIGRIQRQQMLTRALIEQALKPQTLLKIPDILGILQSYLDTNLSMEELVAVAAMAAKTPRSDVQMLMLPGDFSNNGRHSASYWLPNSRKIQTIASQYFEAIPPATDSSFAEESQDSSTLEDPFQLRIAIQDSNDNSEAVQALVRQLSEAGYRRIVVTQKWREPLKKTRIVAQNGDTSGAANVRASLGLGEVLVESTGYLLSDITIQVGQDWQQKTGIDSPFNR